MVRSVPTASTPSTLGLISTQGLMSTTTTMETDSNISTSTPPPSSDSHPPSSNTTIQARTKENDGRGRRRRFVVRFFVLIVILLASVPLLWTYWLAGVFVPDFEIDPITGRKKYRRRPDRLYKINKYTLEKVPTNPHDGIMEGYLTLIDITLPKNGLHRLTQKVSRNGVVDYSGVKATFCHISWALQQKNPAQVPMFRDLQQQSSLCSGTMVRDMDLYQIVREAEMYDNKLHNYTVSAQQSAHHHVVPPTAVVFHETRCGSTLVSNLLAASKPPNVRSYSEAPPPLMALMACDILEQQGQYCDKMAHMQVIRDVFFMLGRFNRPESPQFVFYKIQSIGVRYISLFTTAFPKTPWAFIYRDAVEIIMSHLKHVYVTPKQPLTIGDGKKQTKPKAEGRPVCLRSYGKPNQHPLIKYVVENVAGRNFTSLTKEEYCAAHLASLAQAAVQEYQIDPPRDNFVRLPWFFNYKNLPHAIWEVLLPRLHIGYVDGEMKGRLQNLANVYSKDRAPTKKGEFTMWKEDSTAKQNLAPEAVRVAAKTFVDPIYQTMLGIEKTQY